MADFIPDGDGAFDIWQKALLDYLNAHLADFGLAAADVAAANAKRSTWEAKYAALTPAENAYSAAVDEKDTALANLQAEIRSLNRHIQAKPGVTAASKSAAGLPVYDTVPTPVGPPTSFPVGQVDTSVRLVHTIRWRDSNTPTSRAKPKGVRGCEIWFKIGDPAPADAGQLRYAGTDTATPYVMEFQNADAGKMVYYWLRWVSTRNQPGPWSPPISATVVG